MMQITLRGRVNLNQSKNYQNVEHIINQLQGEARLDILTAAQIENKPAVNLKIKATKLLLMRKKFEDQASRKLSST